MEAVSSKISAADGIESHSVLCCEKQCYNDCPCFVELPSNIGFI
jgi:hypothetical protein